MLISHRLAALKIKLFEGFKSKSLHLGDRVTTDDTKEKRNVGELWAAKSKGKGLFVMGEKRNAQGLSLAGQIAKVVG